MLSKFIENFEYYKKQLAQLETEYWGKNKGRVYAERNLQLSNAIKFWQKKARMYGREGSIIKVNFIMPQAHNDINIYHKHEIYYTGVSMGDVEKLVKLNYPQAMEIKSELIIPGNLKKIEEH